MNMKVNTFGFVALAVGVHLVGISMASASCLDAYSDAIGNDVKLGIATGNVFSATSSTLRTQDIANVRGLIVEAQIGQGMLLNQMASQLSTTPAKIAEVVLSLDAINGFCLDGPVSSKLAQAMVAQAIVR